MGEHIFYGPWVNWTHGPIVGATLTLSDAHGALLTAFIATFVTLVGAQLFKILTYVFHQFRSSTAAKDGLSILRLVSLTRRQYSIEWERKFED